jgi:hypothetical protein
VIVVIEVLVPTDRLTTAARSVVARTRRPGRLSFSAARADVHDRRTRLEREADRSADARKTCA